MKEPEPRDAVTSDGSNTMVARVRPRVLARRVERSVQPRREDR